MKFNIKKSLALLLVGAMCTTGCSLIGGNSVKLDDVSKMDIFGKISEEANIENNKAKEDFAAALQAVNEKENLTIKVSTTMNMGATDSDYYEGTSSEALVKFAKDGDKNVANVDIGNKYSYIEEPESGENASEPKEETNNITGYFSGDTLYFMTGDGDKVQESMSFEDLKSMVNSYSLSIFSECISRAACVEKGNNKTYYVSYDPEIFENTMNTNMEAAGQSLGDGEAMKVNYANIVANVDKDGVLTSYGFSIDANYTTDTGSYPYVYTILADFSDFDNTKVTAVDDMDSYMTAEEYQQKIAQENSATAEENNETASEAPQDSAADTQATTTAN